MSLERISGQRRPERGGFEALVQGARPEQRFSRRAVLGERLATLLVGHTWRVTWAVVFVAGFLIGFAVASWWALLAAVAFGAYIYSVTEVEIPHLFVGFFYAITAVAGIAAGVLARTRRRRKTG